MGNIGLQDTAAVENGIAKLKIDFAWHKDNAKAIYQVARKLGCIDDSQALDLYQYILSTKPTDDRAVQSQANMGVNGLRLGKDQAAELIFEQVISNYAGHRVRLKGTDDDDATEDSEFCDVYVWDPEDSAIRFYVNTDCGHDGYNGKSMIPDGGDGPLASIQAAIDKVGDGSDTW